MKLQEFFTQHPVFTRDDLAAQLDLQGGRSPRTVDSLLAYHVRAGHLLRIRRGLYAALAAGNGSAVDPYLVAARLAPDAVLAYHTALELHGRAHSAHHEFLICTGHRIRPLMFRGHRFRALRPPKALRDRRRVDAGVDVVDRFGLEVRVTGLERTLVDVLDRPDLSGGWEEVWRSLETVEFFDLDAVVEYVLLLDNATTAAKLGLFLDLHRETLMVEEDVLDQLRGLRPRQPHYIDRRARESSHRLIAPWNLVVPESLLLRSWEEVA